MSFFDSITKIFEKPNDKILGVDIGSSSIKIVQLSRKKGVPVLDTFGEISLSVFDGKTTGRPVNLPEDKLITALGDLMKESQVDSTDVAFAIPLKSTLMFNLKLPKTIDESKLDDTVRLEARKYIPVPISEVQLDWSVIPASASSRDKDDFYDIIVIAIHKETLNKYVNIASALKLDLKFLEIETFSTIRSVVKYERDTSAIVDIGSSMTKFYIVENGIIRKSHIINIGSFNMLKIFSAKDRKDDKISQTGLIGESVKLLRNELRISNDLPVDLIRIINEIKKAIVKYQKENKKDIDNIVFTGGGSIFEEVLPYVKKELSIGVEVADPFSKVDNPAFLDNALRATGPEFAVAIGLGLRGLAE
ncbi:MAG TPA: type IV pilus assembly protein PilM [Candidatus Pacebacteria bacterium]|nr:type IV pilus assembly protein PilM [Candidatus Paceibacterota bacterium]